MHQTTYVNAEAATHPWFVVSAKGQVLGRLAVRIATALMGRNRADWTPWTDQGGFVVVTDADQVVFTGQKAQRKTYVFHSRYFGGVREETLGRLHARRPEQVLTLAVRRMLPKNRMARDMIRRLKVYAGPAHPHAAQKPAPLP